MTKNFFRNPDTNLYVFAIVIIALVFRRYDAFVCPQLYAEDGAVFLQQYKELGWLSLFKPYAGYLNAIPRIVAGIWGHAALIHTPACYNYSSLMITVFVALYLLYSAEKLTLRHPIVFATSFLFLPLDSEIYMNLTNLVWITSLPIICYVFSWDAMRYGAVKSKAIAFFKYLLLVILCLSGPCALIIAPIIVLLLWKNRRVINRQNVLPLLIILCCGIIQLVCLTIIDPGTQRRGAPNYREWHLVRLFTENVEDLFFLKSSFFQNFSQTTLAGIALAILFILTVAFVRLYMNIKYVNKYVLLFAGLSYFISFIIVFWPNESDILALYSARYYFIPYACISWLLILGWDKHLRPAFIASYLAFFSFHAPLIVFALPDKDWEGKILEYKNGYRESIAINPEGWQVKLPVVMNPYRNVNYAQYDPKIVMNDGGDTLIPLWSNNPVMSGPVELPQGRYTIKLVSKGSIAGGVLPHLHVFINDDEIGNFFTTERFRLSNPFKFEWQGGAFSIKINMDNDGVVDGVDRNAFIWAIYIFKD
ncbi:MAG: hypothetical protein J0H46_01260 [Bacteroidetes bacterium]|nr:hypothetical protein [Bacteroidota bacterium]